MHFALRMCYALDMPWGDQGASHKNIFRLADIAIQKPEDGVFMQFLSVAGGCFWESSGLSSRRS